MDSAKAETTEQGKQKMSSMVVQTCNPGIRVTEQEDQEDLNFPSNIHVCIDYLPETVSKKWGGKLNTVTSSH